MALADIRTAIRAALESVADVGVVTDYEPLATRQEDFERFFKHPALSYIQGWTVSREATDERVRDASPGNRRNHAMVVRGYRAIGSDGATEQAFQDLIEAVCARLRRETVDKYGGQYNAAAPQVRLVEPRTFSGYLVHYTEITQVVTEWPVVIAP